MKKLQFCILSFLLAFFVNAQSDDYIKSKKSIFQEAKQKGYSLINQVEGDNSCHCIFDKVKISRGKKYWIVFILDWNLYNHKPLFHMYNMRGDGGYNSTWGNTKHYKVGKALITVHNFLMNSSEKLKISYDGIDFEKSNVYRGLYLFKK